MTTGQLSTALTELRDALRVVRLPLPMPGAASQQQVAKEIVDQLDDYVLPRLKTIDAPLLCVVGGSTGAGKSTLVNSLIGRKVTIPGVIRPTTKAPVLVHNPADESWFQGDRILPGMTRTQGASHDTRSLQLVSEPTLPVGLAVLDAPDIDSVVAENRELAAQLLQAADLWVFVTSAARYADAVPWEYLCHAAERAAAVAVVVDRVPPAAMHDVPPHLAQMMTERGLADSPLFAVPETRTDAEGMLPNAAVTPIREWLASLAADRSTRQSVVVKTLDGAIGHLSLRAPRVAAAVRDQSAAVRQLQADADASVQAANKAIQVQTADGTLLRGEVLSRWHDFVGTGEFFRQLDEKVGWLRDRIRSVFTGPPKGAENVKVAVEAGLEALIREEGEKAVERAEAAWRANPAGRALLEMTKDDLRRPSPEFAREASRAIRDWQGDVMDLVAQEGQTKRTTARFLAIGVNGISVSLMLVIFAQTAGLTGAEVGVAGGAALLSQRLLEAVFGDEAVRRLAQRARDLLNQRVETLLGHELDRFHAALRALSVEPGQADRIEAAVQAVEQARLQGLPLGSAEILHQLPASMGGTMASTRLEQRTPMLAQSESMPAALGSASQVAVNPFDTQPGSYGGSMREIVDAEIIEQPQERQ